MSFISLNLEQPEINAGGAGGVTLSESTGYVTSDTGAMQQIFASMATQSGQRVSPEKAKRCAAVLACMRGISEDLAALPLRLYRRGPNGDEEAVDHNLYRILDTAPNAVMTSMELREHILFDLFLHGNFYVLINDDPENPGQIESLWPLSAGYCARLARQLVWTFTDPTTGESGTFTPDLVWRGSILSDNALDGQALTLLAREAIGLLLAAEEQGARLFKQGIQTDLSLSTADTLDTESKNDLRRALMERHAGAGNAWMPLLLEGGLTAGRIGLTAQESQYMDARGFQISEIARIFRYPEVLLGSTGKSSKSSTYASAEQFFQSYTKHTLTPWAVRIEQTIQRDLLTTKEQKKLFVKHDFTSLLRGDTAARYASYSTGIASGFISPAEARKSENKPYVEGLDYFTKPMNMDATAGPDASATKPTDVSGQTPERRMARRVANAILQKEHKALIGQKAEADTFYANFGGFVSEMTGADFAAALSYLEARRTNADRFSPEAQDAALDALVTLITTENSNA